MNILAQKSLPLYSGCSFLISKENNRTYTNCQLVLGIPSFGQQFQLACAPSIEATARGDCDSQRLGGLQPTMTEALFEGVG
jgi:hypothetical protein